MRASLACLALAVVLTGCGSSAETGTATRTTPPSPLVRLEVSLRREYGLRSPECSGVAGAPSHYVCYVDSHGAMLRLAVTKSGRRGPVVTSCTVAKEKANQFGTCTVSSPHSSRPSRAH